MNAPALTLGAAPLLALLLGILAGYLLARLEVRRDGWLAHADPDCTGDWCVTAGWLRCTVCRRQYEPTDTTWVLASDEAACGEVLYELASEGAEILERERAT